MDTPGSDSATDSTDTSTSDSSSHDSPSEQIITNLNEDNTVTNTIAVDDDEDNDSEWDVSMSAETDDEDDEAPRPSTIQVNPGMHILEQQAASTATEPVDGPSNKRKLSETAPETPNGYIPSWTSNDTRKRFKPDDMNTSYRTSDGFLCPDKSLLPAEIWHHIFTFIPPRTLGLLLPVNRSFNAYLDPSSFAPSNTPLARSVVQTLKPDSIWQASRRFFWSGMPAPLRGKSELEMWKLACALSCQFCGKEPSRPTTPSDQWHPGPGENGTVSIWSFGVHTCGTCIQERCSKVGEWVIPIVHFSQLTYGRKLTCFCRQPFLLCFCRLSLLYL